MNFLHSPLIDTKIINGMARLRRQDKVEHEPSDDSFSQIEHSDPAESVAKLRSSPRKNAAKSYFDEESSSSEEPQCRLRSVKKATENTRTARKQIRLVPLSTVNLSKPLPNNVSPTQDLFRSKGSSKFKHPGRISPLRQHAATKQDSTAKIVHLSDNSAEIEVEESIWCGSARASDDSDEELPSPRKLIRLPRKPTNLHAQPAASDLSSSSRESALSGNGRCSGIAEVAKKCEPISSRPQSSSDKENAAAFLQFSPPRLYSPAKTQQRDRLVTPPPSPSKSRLQSPSKTRPRVPTPTLRPSLDAFWDIDTVNDWNDQYSPQKTLKSPRKLKFLKEDALASPTSSPRKSKSPSKTTRAERDVKKDFEARKHGVAEKFLSELDEVVTGGKVKELAATTGGVHFVWSKTLNSTAGRANWRKETTKTRKLDGTVEITYKHHASIELAEKVIDDENRLLNVIAHEFCHLANFMISGIKDKPHGHQFKEWGGKCTQAFKDRGVEVTTKHSYQIEYKYIWQCSNEDCAVEFKRHSKSIDPKRHTCGTCRSKLVQIKPAPRKDAGNATGYAAYVKANFAEVKRGMPGASQKEVMEAVGRKYRAEKNAKDNAVNIVGSASKEASVDVNELTRGLEVITIDDD